MYLLRSVLENVKTILPFMELLRVMILKMIFVFEGRKPYKSFDRSTVHPLLNMYLEPIYFSTLYFVDLYCGYGMVFRSSSRPEMVCDSSCSPYITWAHTVPTEVSTRNCQPLINSVGEYAFDQVVSSAAKFLLTRIVGRAVNYALITLLLTYLALLLLRNMSIILSINAYKC